MYLIQMYSFVWNIGWIVRELCLLFMLLAYQTSKVESYGLRNSYALTCIQQNWLISITVTLFGCTCSHGELKFTLQVKTRFGSHWTIWLLTNFSEQCLFLLRNWKVNIQSWVHMLCSDDVLNVLNSCTHGTLKVAKQKLSGVFWNKVAENILFQIPSATAFVWQKRHRRSELGLSSLWLQQQQQQRLNQGTVKWLLLQSAPVTRENPEWALPKLSIMSDPLLPPIPESYPACSPV